LKADELKQLVAWLGSPPRHPEQTHAIDESDAEVVQLGPSSFLAVSVDALSDELASGLYADPYTMGWVAATAGLADVAAVGADPIGALLVTVWGPEWDAGRRARLGAGFADSLRASGAALLGGDSGSGLNTVLSVCGVGRASSPPLSRVGAMANDILCVTGAVGRGAALGIRLLRGEPAGSFPEDRFRPQARLSEGAALRQFASACTDASDGLVEAVGAIAAGSGLGAVLEWTPSVVDDAAAEYLRERDLPLWLAWLAEIGDYELVCTVPAAQLSVARESVPRLVPIGRMRAGHGLEVEVEGRAVPIDAEAPSIADAAREDRPELLARTIEAIRAQGLP
jgi:thiamine-monophosphate kinase